MACLRMGTLVNPIALNVENIDSTTCQPLPADVTCRETGPHDDVR